MWPRLTKLATGILLIQGPMITRVKICGITRVKDLEVALEAGTSAIGLNFYPGSPRYLAPRQAKKILEAIPVLVEAVAVVVDMPPMEAKKLLEQHQGLTALQWHGPVATEFVLLGRWIRGWSVSAATDLHALENHLQKPLVGAHPPKAILLDAKVKGLHGGTGKTLPWELLQGWRSPVPMLLAGGLNPENVAQAIRIVKPFGVDVASGVESSQGIKDPAKIRDFFQSIAWAEKG